ncbi:MAG: efflux transporter periplasmic adaptor subunit [Nitrosomonadales bacterium SCN 54-20]|nr:MAG: efflux transporter periplasmic adaptor subunit [Nitrosomonadales bacterium SCN 54-20]
MKFAARLIVFITLAATVLAAGYWWGSTQSSSPMPETSGVSLSGEEAKAKTKGKILYYRNPMGLPDTSPVPKKDPMGMDYIPVYEGEEPAAGDPVVKISTAKIQKLGVRTEAAAMRELIRTVRAVATVQADERRLYTVAPKFEGWIERLHVNTTGQAVKKGEPLMEVYSPELITAQHEYLIARKGVERVEGGAPEIREAMERLAESALQRLRNWDISETDLQALRQKGQFTRSVTFRSAVNGVVLDKLAIQGERFMAGEVLYQIADLSIVWMLADVFEQDLVLVREGQPAAVRIEAYPEKIFNGKVTFIYPTVNPETRTARVRIELPNDQGLLKPAMYGRAGLASIHGEDKVLAVPESAVLHTGTRQLVLVDLGEGRFEPREVKLGAHGDDYDEVLDGLVAGEKVVVKANFLIDAESNLKSALESFDHRADDLTQGDPEEKQETIPGQAGKATHRGEGAIEAIDVANATVTLAHGPIASLRWPGMTMDFKVLDPALLRALKPGQRIAFEITEESAGEYVIVRIQPAAAVPGQEGHRDGR